MHFKWQISTLQKSEAKSWLIYAIFFALLQCEISHMKDV